MAKKTGLGQLLNTVNLVKKHLNKSLEIEGALLTMYDARTNLSNQVVKEVKKYFGDKSNLSNIKLVGTCTSICVCSNALLLKSLLPEVEITVYPDLCACVSEESHNAAILVMKMNQINIVNYF